MHSLNSVDFCLDFGVHHTLLPIAQAYFKAAFNNGSSQRIQ